MKCNIGEFVVVGFRNHRGVWHAVKLTDGYWMLPGGQPSLKNIRVSSTCQRTWAYVNKMEIGCMSSITCKNCKKILNRKWFKNYPKLLDD
jgi:hypothetical protein